MEQDPDTEQSHSLFEDMNVGARYIHLKRDVRQSILIQES